MQQAEFLEALHRMGLIEAGETPEMTPLAGGVSSDIVRVDLARGPVCIKRARAKLQVAADWRAPVERNHWEREWMKTAGRIVAHAVPQIVTEDRQSGMFAMQYFEPDIYPVWKDQLRDGIIEIATAEDVGRTIATIHAATAGNTDIEQAFCTDHIFVPIRLDPYLRATALKHPACAAALEALARRTASTRKALVHGDVSPKNILVGPSGPVFLDAECAWYGDPAFDLAFCLNHLLLKCIWRPQWAGKYLACYHALARAYLDLVKWEPADMLQQRAAHLLPGLLLGRVDGKSPVEYINDDAQRQDIRDFATALLLRPLPRLDEIAQRWAARRGV